MADPDYIAVRYERNADERGTSVLRFHDDDRDDIVIGGTGALTREEYDNVTAGGSVVLEIVEDEDEAARILEEAKTPEPEPTLNDLSVPDLRQIADEEGVDLSGKNKKEDIVSAIQDARQESGPESLPATASRTAGTTTISGPGAGGAAGPGGAASEPGTSGGGPAT